MLDAQGEVRIGWINLDSKRELEFVGTKMSLSLFLRLGVYILGSPR